MNIQNNIQKDYKGSQKKEYTLKTVYVKDLLEIFCFILNFLYEAALLSLKPK